MSSHGKKTRNPGYKSGDNWLSCDVCGMNILSSDSQKRWDGAIVCSDDWEVRHAQDFVRARKDRQRPDVARSEPTEVNVVRICSSRTSVSGEAVASCMIAGVDGQFVSSEVPSGTFNTNTL